MHGVHDILQTEIHTAKLLVPFGIEIDIEKLNRYKSLGTCQIVRELIQSRDKTAF